jgi:predicted nucleic acid-binding protein
MKGLIHKWLLVDSGFWIGLLDPRDQHHLQARRLLPTVERCHVLLPWPCMYEFLRSRIARRPEAVASLRTILSLSGVERFDDGPYRAKALERCLHPAAFSRGLSLADQVLRSIAEDDHVKLHGIVTFNARDFLDVCNRRRPELELVDEGLGVAVARKTRPR